MGKSFTDRFFEPAEKVIESCKSFRVCNSLPDNKFVISGVMRCLSATVSGRDWVQRAIRLVCSAITVSGFFSSLKSKRRLRLLQEVSESVRSDVDHRCTTDDPFAEIEELSKFEVYAADGHFCKASVHETRIEGKRYGVGHLFAMNLRTLSAKHLDVTRPLEYNKKKESEISVLKRLGAKMLRMGAPVGRKVILAYDPAVINIQEWRKWKNSSGLYVITREKNKMTPMKCGDLDFDRADPRNNGVSKDEQVGSSGVMIRRITYTDPASGKTYVFLTNEMTLPPGVLCFIYKKRWDIEKLFDEFKNHLNNRKAWGDSAVAKCQQAVFICLAHNLLLLIEQEVREETGATEMKLKRQRDHRLANEIKRIKKAGRQPNALAQKHYRPIKRTVQFIREVRVILDCPTSWACAIMSLSAAMMEYLS